MKILNCFKKFKQVVVELELEKKARRQKGRYFSFLVHMNFLNLLDSNSSVRINKGGVMLMTERYKCINNTKKEVRF